MKQLKFLAKNVKVSYKNFSISGIDIELSSGDILGIMGGSGSGKSTIIEALAGLKETDSGNIFMHTPEKGDVWRKENLGYSPQHNALYPLLTLEENIKLFGQLQKMKKKKIETNANHLLSILGLAAHRKKKIIKLSGGMKKRADIACALIHFPKIILLDEPFSGLDISIIKFVWRFLLELAKAGNIIIISSHRINDLKKHCNKICLVHDGKFHNTATLNQILKLEDGSSIHQIVEKIFNNEIEINKKVANLKLNPKKKAGKIEV